MRTDSEIRTEGFKALAGSLGEVETGRFVSLLLRDSFDYTLWQEYMFPDRAIQEISNAAMDFRKKNLIG